MTRYTLAAVAALAVALSVGPALAAETQAVRPAGVRVDLDGLDLQTAAGRAAAEARAQSAVALYCAVNDASSRARAAEARCRSAVMPKVLDQLQAVLANSAVLKTSQGG